MKKKLSALITLPALIVLIGCQQQVADTTYRDVDLSPVRSESGSVTTPAPPDIYRPLSASDEPTGAITLAEALRLALTYNPELGTYPPQVRQAEAEQLQASLRPNPEMEYELEEFGGSGDIKGFDSVINKLHVFQLFELADKRAKRERAAALGIELVKWDYQSQRLDVTAEVMKSYLKILAAQQRVVLAEDLVQLSKKVLTTVDKRVEAGKDSPVEQSKARVALANFSIELQLAQSNLAAAQRHLAATWGSQGVTFESAEGTLETVSKFPVATQKIPLLEQLQQLLYHNPDLARGATQIEQYQRVIDLEEAKTVADPAVGVGIHHYNESGDVGLMIGLEVPLQFFDRNQAGVMASKHQLAQAQIEQHATRIKLDAALYEAYKALLAARSVVKLLQADALPNVQKAFDAANLGYQEGKFDYLDVLDAQRTLFEARGQYIEALKMYHQAVTDIERLIGGPLFRNK